jgi:hypothetical protein
MIGSRSGKSAIACLCAAWWTVRATASARRQLAADPTSAVRALPPVPSVAGRGARGVAAALRVSRSTCLVQATVRQAWYAAHGEFRDVVIGVTAPAAGFAAHAWLDGDAPCHSEGFEELLRRPGAAQP